MRRAMRIVEAAWLAHPHPDLADAYAHVRLGDSARQRLVRVETLAAKAPGHLESALAVARAAIDASEFARAREALAPFVDRADAAGGDADGGNRAHRAWRQRPGAGLDAARGARAARSGLDRGRLCFRQMAAGVAGDPAGSTRSSGRRRSRRCRRTRVPRSKPRHSTKRCWRRAAPRRAAARRSGRAGTRAIAEIAPAASRRRTIRRPSPAIAAEPAPSRRHRRPPPAESARRHAGAAVPRPRRSRQSRARRRIPPVIPIVRAPDDPGIDDDAPCATNSRNKSARRRARPAAGAGFCRAGAAKAFSSESLDIRFGVKKTRRKSTVPLADAFFLPNRALPDIRCGRFQAVCRTRRMVRRNSSVGRARHS